ncbi:hypothetical protein GSU68_16545 [Rathayibacter sp. VKM Ac-2759]|uniref:polysaccharide pyruvyl transferase family protein n=1 Tax=Rathayibacter sp. VKM Ac-2759 TaxID=2609252 RepID=UPI00131760FB|nr:polysaccharide pyruvyl transferase family protein [Rathayibacter sp. VKM Ac-2759]QHC68017.1 hypothetical protein GSU68_16545 [Rathayibacter sp. VKM Ac-2759]
MTSTPRRIVFLGTHGQHNIGDELLLETFLTRLGSEHRYVVNSYDPDGTRRQLGDRFDVEVIDTARDRILLLRRLLTCDLLCFGGGSIVKELYASTGRHRHSTLLMLLGVVTFAHLVARRPIAMLHIGVGPLRTRLGRRLARTILKQVDELTVRDGLSLETCRRIGVDAARVPDAVFSHDRADLLPGTPPDAVRGERLRIALNLNIDIEAPERWEPFLDALAAALLAVGAQRPIELHALPMQIGFKARDDAEVLDAFAARVPDLPFVRHRPGDAAAVARILEDCDALVGERLHAVVLASVLGVPSYVLAYDVKVRELVSILGLDEWSVDINRPFDPGVLSERLVALLDRRAAVSESVAARADELRGETLAAFTAARAWIDSAGGTA